MESECECICACVCVGVVESVVYGLFPASFCANNEVMQRREKKIGKSVIAFICLKRWEHDSPATKFRSVGNLIRFRAQNITKDTENVEEEEEVVVANRESDRKTDDRRGRGRQSQMIGGGNRKFW